jgi:hypothetical protein
MSPIEGAESSPPESPNDDVPARRPGESITDYGAVAFILVLFVLGLGLMYLIGRGR